MQKNSYFIILLLLTSLSYGQTTYIDISVSSAVQAADEHFRVYLDDYNTAIVTWPIDRVEQRELLASGSWGPWELTSPIPLGYDGSRYYFTTSVTKRTQIRFADPVSGGTAYSNTLTVSVRDQEYNWIEARSFDENGDEISRARQYFDKEGRVTQSQSLDPEHDELFASEPLYDDLDRTVGQTLSAPIGQSQFDFKEGFATVDGDAQSVENVVHTIGIVRVGGYLGVVKRTDGDVVVLVGPEPAIAAVIGAHHGTLLRFDQSVDPAALGC